MVSSLMGVATFAGSTWEFNYLFDEIAIDYNSYGTPDKYETSIQWQAGNRGALVDAVEDATGSIAWTPEVGQGFMVKITGYASMTGQLEMAIVDERQVADYYTALSSSYPSTYVYQGEYFELEGVMFLDNVTMSQTGIEVEGGLTDAGLVLGFLYEGSSMDEGFSSAEPFVISQASMEVVFAEKADYENPLVLSYRGVSKLTENYQYETHLASSVSGWDVEVGKYINVTFKGTARTDISKMFYQLADNSYQSWGGYFAPTTSSEVEFAENISAGDNVDYSFSFPIEYTTEPYYYGEYQMVDVIMVESPDKTLAIYFENASIEVTISDKAQYGSSYTFVDNGIMYEYISDTEVKVVANNYSGDVVIPSTASNGKNTYTVTYIPSDAFAGNTKITSITIPESITYIEESAFNGCTSLTTVNYNAKNCRYGDGYWYTNPCFGASVTTLNIGEKVEEVSSYLFKNCTALTSVSIESNMNVASLELSFEKDGLKYRIKDKNSVSVVSKGHYEEVPGQWYDEWVSDYTGEIVIPETVTAGTIYTVKEIGERAFLNSTGMTSISLPKTVETIGYEAFDGCTALTSLSIESDVDVSNAGLYFTKDGIKYHILTKNTVEVAHTGRWTYDDEGYENWVTDYKGEIVIPETVTTSGSSYTVTGLGYEAFYHSEGLTSLTIPNTVTTIGGNVIGDCKNLIEYKGPAVIFDDPEDYYNSHYFEKLTITKGEISRYGFSSIRECENLKELDMSGAENTAIPEGVFYDHYKLEKVELPSQLETIGYKSFAGCTALKEIVIPETVTTIGTSAFEDCRKLENVVFEGSEGAIEELTVSLETIGDWAFYNCHNLKLIDIPEGVTTLGDAAFYGCTYLEALALPASLKSMGDNTFALCENLKAMYVWAEIPPSLFEKTFYNVDRSIPIVITESAWKAYSEAEYWNEFINLQPCAINEVSADANNVTIANGQILVNGEAPAFVVTVTGQKVANKNLKNGVYFIAVAGESIKVVK